MFAVGWWMGTLEKRVEGVNAQELSEVDVSLTTSRFLRYYDDKPEALFVEAGRVDLTACVLLERDLQDAYDAKFKQVAGELPSRRIRWDEECLSVHGYCASHEFPVLFVDGTPSPKIHSGVYANLEKDLECVRSWAIADAREYLRGHRKRASKASWRTYAAVLGINLLATGALLFGAHLYVVNTYLSVKYDDGKQTMHPAVENIASVIENRTRASVREEVDAYVRTSEDEYGNVVLSERVRPLVDAIKQELISTSREELAQYFSVSVDGQGRQYLHPEIEPLAEYIDVRLEQFMDEYREQNPGLFPSPEVQQQNIRSAVLDAIEDPETRRALRAAIFGR